MGGDGDGAETGNGEGQDEEADEVVLHDDISPWQVTSNVSATEGVAVFLS